MGTALAERRADRILRRDRYYAALRFAARRTVGEHERYWRRGFCRWRTARSDGCDAGPWAAHGSGSASPFKIRYAFVLAAFLPARVRRRQGTSFTADANVLSPASHRHLLCIKRLRP